MNENLTVSLIQSALYWENRAKNLEMFSHKIELIEQKTDLIILPEMFTTGFTMDVENQGEEFADNSETMIWLRSEAKKSDAVIIGSFIAKVDSNYYNRLIWMRSDGSYEYYDKRHLFRMAGEDEKFSEGNNRLTVNLNGWNICPMICYDLRFPVWSRNVDLEYDLLIYVANWPDRRRRAWDILLQARAVENLSYCIGVNRVGEDGNEIDYYGNSAVVDYTGDRIYYKTKHNDIFTTELSKSNLQEYRKKFPANLDADRFSLS